jgi:hypothetical protein
MHWRGGREVDSQWLSPLQRKFLRRFFASGFGPKFFLTGGTALSAFYLHHRVSVDLDLFTLDELALREGEAVVPRIAGDLGCRLGRSRRTEHFAQFLLEPESGDPLLVELVRDFGPQYGEPLVAEGVVVDSMVNIGANKLTAILGRTEPKDFVDLYFLLQAGLDFDDLLVKAQTKDTGMQPFFLAASLLQVRQLPRLPVTTPALARTDLEAEMLRLADRLLDRIRPGSPQGGS